MKVLSLLVASTAVVSAQYGSGVYAGRNYGAGVARAGSISGYGGYGGSYGGSSGGATGLQPGSGATVGNSRSTGGSTGIRQSEAGTHGDGGAEATQTPWDLFNEKHFALSQQRYNVKKEHMLVPTLVFDTMVEGTNFLDSFEDDTADLIAFSQGQRFVDSYKYMIDKLEEAIDHHLQDDEIDHEFLRQLDYRLDAERHKVRGYNYLVWGNYIPEFSNLGRWNVMERRRIDEANTHHILHDTREKYYAGELEYDDYHQAKRQHWVNEQEVSGSTLRFYDAIGAIDSNIWAYPFVQGAASDARRAEDLYWEARDDYYANPSDDTYREMELADLDWESETWGRNARIGQLLGNGLLTAYGWYKDSRADREYADIVYDNLEHGFHEHGMNNDFEHHYYGTPGHWGDGHESRGHLDFVDIALISSITG